MTVSRFILGSVIAAGIIMIGASVVQPVQHEKQVIAAPQTVFDHSGCQYPARTTNPPDGCDNSDPCDPANVKGGSGDCDPVQPEAPATIPGPEYYESITTGGK